MWLTKNEFKRKKLNPTIKDDRFHWYGQCLAAANMTTDEEIIAQIGKTEEESNEEYPSEEVPPTFNYVIIWIKNVKTIFRT